MVQLSKEFRPRCCLDDALSSDFPPFEVPGVKWSTASRNSGSLLINFYQVAFMNG